MIANIIGGFVTILIGVSLIGPISTEVNGASNSATPLFAVSSWGATVLNLVPGFFALGLLGVGVAITYASLRQAGVV